MVSNTIVHLTQIFLTLESAISELQVPELVNQIKTFHQMKCKHAKNIVAAYILDLSIKHCTSATQIQLSNASLLIFQYHFDDTDIQIQFDNKNIHFLLKHKLTFEPGQIKTLRLNCVTNTQVVLE